ncbi:MAG: hypothetical protein K9G62_07520 [Alphaproteobacteria bacterium]|nr:hypothetical protein [Alphaproteobacteria bacterium]
MNTTRFALSVLAVFVFIFLFEWMWHGMIMMRAYLDTDSMWRPMDGQMGYMPFMIASQLLQALMISWIFIQNHEGKGWKEGARYGLYVGILLASIELASYAYLPIAFTMALSWMCAALLKGTGAGIVLALVYKR